MQFQVKQVPLKRIKKSADTSHLNKEDVTISGNIVKEASILKKDLFNNKPIEKSLLSMTEDDSIYAEHYYIDSAGDLIKKANINGAICVIVELCDASLAHVAGICDMNVGETNVRNQSGITRTRVIVDTDATKLVKVSLGLWRNYLMNRNDILQMNVTGVRTTYQNNLNKTIYETDIMCKEEHIENVRNIIKSLNKSNMVIEWYK